MYIYMKTIEKIIRDIGVKTEAFVVGFISYRVPKFKIATQIKHNNIVGLMLTITIAKKHKT